MVETQQYPKELQVKPDSLLSRWRDVLVTGFLGSGMQSTVYAVEALHRAAERQHLASALKIYHGAYAESRSLVKKSKELHTLLERHGIPTYEYMTASKAIVGGEVRAALEMPNLTQDGAVVITSNSFRELQHADQAVLALIAKIDRADLSKQLEHIARRCAFLGLAVATHVYSIVVQQDGKTEVIVGDLESFFKLPPDSALPYNLQDAAIVSGYPNVILGIGNR